MATVEIPRSMALRFLRSVGPFSARGWHAGFWLPPLLLVAVAAVALPYDVGIARACTHPEFPDVLREVFDNVEPFGHGVGVFVVFLLVALLERKRFAMAWRVMGAGIGAGLTADLVKITIERTRPRDFELAAGTAADTWGEWLPLMHGLEGGLSFPSAHTATAAAMAIVLSHLYPRARYLFAILVVLVACHRLQSGAHYLSDVCVGAALGWTFGYACWYGPLSGWFRQVEARLTAQYGRQPRPLHQPAHVTSSEAVHRTTCG